MSQWPLRGPTLTRWGTWSRAGLSLTGMRGCGPRSLNSASSRGFVARDWRWPRAGGRRLLFCASDRDNDRKVDWCEIDAYEHVPLNHSVRTGEAVVGSLNDLAGCYPGFRPPPDLGDRRLAASPADLRRRPHSGRLCAVLRHTPALRPPTADRASTIWGRGWAQTCDVPSAPPSTHKKIPGADETVPYGALCGHALRRRRPSCGRGRTPLRPGAPSRHGTVDAGHRRQSGPVPERAGHQRDDPYRRRLRAARGASTAACSPRRSATAVPASWSTSAPSRAGSARRARPRASARGRPVDEVGFGSNPPPWG